MVNLAWHEIDEVTFMGKTDTLKIAALWQTFSPRMMTLTPRNKDILDV